MHVSTGDLFRYNLGNNTELGILAKSFMDKGQLVPDEVTSDMLKDHLLKNKDQKGFILDGYPRTIKQAETLDLMLKELFNAEVTTTLSLVVEDNILINRLLERGKTSGRSDDSNKDVIESRLKEYYKQTQPVSDYYKANNKLVEINGVGAKVSPDLSLAKIYISVFPKENRQVVFKDIEKSKPQIRLEIGNSLKNQLRIIPDLRFYLDESIDNVELIEKELKGEGNNPKL
ncbi:unnamed protein product, partial [Darwinula stevensoni]